MAAMTLEPWAFSVWLFALQLALALEGSKLYPNIFVVNLGKGKDDLMLHFSVRFDAHGDVKTIVCNSKNKGQWGTEQRESNFPFQEGSSTELFFTHDKNDVTVTLPGNHQIKFPNALASEGIEYACVEGDIVFKGISIA